MQQRDAHFRELTCGGPQVLRPACCTEERLLCAFQPALPMCTSTLLPLHTSDSLGLTDFSLSLLKHYHQHTNMLLCLWTACHSPTTAPFPFPLQHSARELSIPRHPPPVTKFPPVRLLQLSTPAQNLPVGLSRYLGSHCVHSTILGSETAGSTTQRIKALCPRFTPSGRQRKNIVLYLFISQR